MNIEKNHNSGYKEKNDLTRLSSPSFFLLSLDAAAVSFSLLFTQIRHIIETDQTTTNKKNPLSMRKNREPRRWKICQDFFSLFVLDKLNRFPLIILFPSPSSPPLITPLSYLPHTRYSYFPTFFCTPSSSVLCVCLCQSE